MIDWKMIETTTKNSIKQINMGIRQSSKKYVTIINPDWEFQNDVIYQLRNNLDNYPNHYAIGQVHNNGYCGIMARKGYFEKTGGLDENCPSKELSLENLRRRMELLGIRMLFYKEALL